MPGEFSNTFPPIGFPFDDAANSVKLSHAIATLLCLAISFKLGKIGTFLMTFNGASHGFCSVETMVRNEGAISSPQLYFLTKGSAAIGIGVPFFFTKRRLAGVGFPLLRQLLGFNAGASRHMDGAVERGDAPLIHHGAIEIPGFADVQEAGQLQRAGIGSAVARLDRERLVPVGHGDREANGVEPVKSCVGVSGGELLDGVIDAGHG